MRSLNSSLDRFCAKHSRLGVPNLMRYIVIGTVAVFLLDMFSNGTCSALLSFNAAAIFKGQIWRLVTFVFIPMGGGAFSLMLSLYLYWMIGTTLEREWGTTKFTVFYGLGVLLNIVAGLFIGYANMDYVNMSLFLAFATLYPNMQFLLFFIIPVKAKWMAWFDAAVFALGIFRYLSAGLYLYALIPVVAVLNYLIFFAGDISYVFRRAKRRVSPEVVNFKKAQKTAKETKGYLHKCAVCGKTDTEYPNLEFRYCSKCNGYYCYCMDHINSHVHVE